MAYPNTLNSLLKIYARIETALPIRDATKRYGSIVTASDNEGYPVQRWFRFKEGFSVDLLPILLEDWQIDKSSISRVLDPFCGSGTSLLSVQRLARLTRRSDFLAVGFECNPFLNFVANTKASWDIYDPLVLASRSKTLGNLARLHPRIPQKDLPPLSTLRRRDIIDPRVLRKLISVSTAIRRLKINERDPLLLGFSSALELLTSVRKDGRALRITPAKQRERTHIALQQSWASIAEDLRTAPLYYSPIKTRTILGDGRNLTRSEGRSKPLIDFDLVLYSPPYLNNIDYTEVYKLELWLAGFVSDAEAFRALRKKTFRSHPSVRFSSEISMNGGRHLSEVHSTLEALVSAIPKDRHQSWRTVLFPAYFDDMYRSLGSQFRALRPGARAFCIVGNSLHGPADRPHLRLPIASDIIIAMIAMAVGFDLLAIDIARPLRRRSPHSHYLRESIIVLRKPGA